MKTLISTVAVLMLVASSGQQNASTTKNDQPSDSSIEQQIEGQDAQIIIDAFKRAEVTSTSRGGVHPTTSWSVKNLRCSESTMELVAPGGGGFMIRVIDECTFSKAN